MTACGMCRHYWDSAIAMEKCDVQFSPEANNRYLEMKAIQDTLPIKCFVMSHIRDSGRLAEERANHKKQ